MEDKELIDVMLEERKLAVQENNEYGKMQMQLFTIFFAFLGVAVGLGISGQTWIWVLLQLVIPMFYMGSSSLEQNIMMNGAFLIFNENRINRLARRKVCFWQDFVSYSRIDADKKVHLRFYLPLVSLSLLFAVVYALPIYFLSKEQVMFESLDVSLPLNRVLSVSTLAAYLTSSAVAFILTTIAVAGMRNRAVRSIILLAEREKQRFDTEELIVPRG